MRALSGRLGAKSFYVVKLSKVVYDDMTSEVIEWRNTTQAQKIQTLVYVVFWALAGLIGRDKIRAAVSSYEAL